MSEFIFIMIFVILLVVILAEFICFIACYMTHIKMNKERNLPYDYVNFKTFRKVFTSYMDKYKDNLNIDIKYGFYNSPAVFMRNKYDYNNELIYLHADIVRFEKKCMIFYPWSYIKYCRWIRKFVNNKRVKDLWKDN